jgi:single-stranded-DNA-specific exonuclease
MFPHRRHDGYGLKTKHIDMMIKEETDLIITVDNGITSIAEASYAREQNIDLIITDHHHA